MVQSSPDSPDLVSLLDAYECGINTLTSSAQPDVEVVFATLTARDRINTIVRGNSTLDKELFACLFVLDCRLEGCADLLNDYDLLEKCRLSYRAP